MEARKLIKKRLELRRAQNTTDIYTDTVFRNESASID